MQQGVEGTSTLSIELTIKICYLKIRVPLGGFRILQYIMRYPFKSNWIVQVQCCQGPVLKGPVFEQSQCRHS